MIIFSQQNYADPFAVSTSQLLADSSGTVLISDVINSVLLQYKSPKKDSVSVKGPSMCNMSSCFSVGSQCIDDL